MNSARIVIALLLAAAVGAGWYLLGPPDSQPESPQAVGRVTIAASLTLSPAPVWVALDRGFFHEAGIEATVKPYSSGKTTTEGMLKGEVELSASAEFLAARKFDAHPELRILGTLAFVHQIKMLGLKERGFESLADLRGKRIAVKLGTNGEYFLQRLLTLNGMGRKDIQWVDMKPQAMNDALAEGAVDGVLVWPPFVQRIVDRLGERLAVFDGQPGQDYYYVVLGREEWIDANPEISERVMRALLMAERWMAEHPDEAAAYLETKMNVPASMIGKALEEYRFSIALPQALVIAMESELQWLKAQGLTKAESPPNVLDLIDPAPLRAADPARVTILR